MGSALAAYGQFLTTANTRLPNNRTAIELVARGIEASGFQLGEDVAIAVDVAATQFVTQEGLYHFVAEDRFLESAELVDEVATWCRDFPIVSIEDVLAEDDWGGWKYASEHLAGIQLLGDDLFVTQVERLAEGKALGVANAVLVKVNQNGTLTGGLDVVTQAQRTSYAPVISARSGETEDTWLADIAVGSRAGQIKVGSTTRSERTAKWNRLLQIERAASLLGNVEYAGRNVLTPRIDDEANRDLRPDHL